MKIALKILKKTKKCFLNTIISIISLSGIISTSTQANTLPKPIIQQQIEDVRLRLLESDRQINKCKPIVESEDNKTSIAQWYNFPNFPNWGNWGNFPNYWRNY